MNDPVQNSVEAHKILVVAVPPSTTDKLQPLDLSVNKAAKIFLRDLFHHWYAELVITVLGSGEPQQSSSQHDYSSNEKT